MDIAFTPFSLLFIIAIIVTTILIVYRIIYKKNINKALQENNGKHIALPDIPSALPVILIIVSCCCIVSSIFSLSTQTSLLQNNMESSLSKLEAELDKLNATLNKLNDASKLVSSYDYHYENFNPEDMTVEVDFEVTLKSFNENTKISISLDENVIELKKSPSGTYTGYAALNIFETISTVTALIANGDTIQTEQLEDVYIDYLWMDFYPYMDCTFSSNCDYKKNKLYFNDELDITLSNTDSYYFTDIYIEIFADNKFIKKIDIDNSINTTDFTVILNEAIPVNSQNSTVDIFVIGTDSAGFTHKYLTFSGNNTHYTIDGNSEEIYDKDGKQLTHD